MINQTTQNQPVIITLPDGGARSFEQAVSGYELAASIGAGLAKAALAVKVNGTLKDLRDLIVDDASVQIITAKDTDGMEIIRHDTAHILAQAVKALYPDVQVTIGPAIENGFYYDFARKEPFHEADLAKIEAKMNEIVKQNQEITQKTVSRDEAVAYFTQMGEIYKAEIIASIPEDDAIKLYSQGEFTDLCRGPHAMTTGASKAFKLLSVAGAYWRGDSNNEMLQRIYGTAWADKKQLAAYLTQLEEAEKRDHRKLGQQMDLFHFEDSAPGQPFWHDKGWKIYNTLMGYMRQKLEKYGYSEVNTPQVLDVRFWQYSGHWDKYRENMFVVDETAEQPMALKPMSCPGNVQVYKTDLRSYRDLPLRMAEFGKVFRHEPSGARHGLMRVQAFTQDDAHIFCTSQQLEDEVVKMCDFISEVYRELGFDDVLVKFSTRPEQRIGSEEDWNAAEAALQKVCERMGFEWELNPGDGAFYAPKLDFVLRDAIGRQWQCGTIQVDMNLPNRLDIHYIGEDGNKHRPHLVHRAILGSFERFIGILIEHYAGHFPLWLAPVQVAIATVTDASKDYAYKVDKALKEAGLRVHLDVRNEKISYKVREHSHKKTPVILAVGAREAGEGTVTVRRLGSQAQETLALSALIEALLVEINKKETRHS